MSPVVYTSMYYVWDSQQQQTKPKTVVKQSYKYVITWRAYKYRQKNNHRTPIR